MVIIPLVTAGVAHGIHGRGATQGLAPGDIDLAIVQGFLGYGVITPVSRVGAHHQDDAGRNADKQAIVCRARFQQADTIVGVFGKTVGKYAASRTGADNNVIKLHDVCLELG